MQPKDVLNANSNNIKMIQLKLSSMSLEFEPVTFVFYLKPGNLSSADLLSLCH